MFPLSKIKPEKSLILLKNSLPPCLKYSVQVMMTITKTEGNNFEGDTLMMIVK